MKITLEKAPGGYELVARYGKPSVGQIVLVDGEAVMVKASMGVTLSRECIILTPKVRIPKQGEVWDVNGYTYLVVRVSASDYQLISIPAGDRRGDTVKPLSDLLSKYDDNEFIAENLAAYYKGK